MISNAILHLQGANRQGCSSVAIRKFIEAHYEVVSSFRSRLQNSIKKAVAEGWLVQIRRSYKLSAEEKQRLKRQAKSKQGENVLNIPLSPDFARRSQDLLDEGGTDSEIEYRRQVRRRVKRRLSFD
jgi:sugar-specific transcriptional regulator TrmB